MNKSHVSSKAALKNATRFKQHSQIKAGEAKGKEAIADKTTATHSASLDLESPAIKAAARNFFAKEPSLASEAVAQYPELAKYLAELGVTIPAGKGSTVLPTSRIVPVFDHEEQGAASPPSEEDMIPDNLLRISETSLDAEGGGAFSMLVAVTQGVLNAQLFYRWGDLDRPEFQTMVSPSPVAPPKNATLFQHGDMIDADLAAPQLALQIGETAQNRGSVLFYINFLGGLCRLWDEETVSLVEADDTFGWRLVFEVDLQLVNLSRTSTEFKTVASKYNVPSSYGISALVAEFKNARLTESTWEPSNFGTFDMKPSRRASFTALVTDWMQNLTMSINYSLVDGTASIPDPTMPPTSQVLQTYPYKTTTTQGVHSSFEGLGGLGDRNMLLYLGMTGGQSMPPTKHLPWKANWVSASAPDNLVAGCLAISRTDFVDNWLIPNLAIINNATYFEVTEASTKKTGPATASYRFSIGKRTDLPESAFNWTKTVSGAKTTYYWSRSRSIKDEDGKNGFKSRAQGSSNVTNILTMQEGSNLITWRTTANLQLSTSLETFWINNKGTAVASRSGTTNIALDSVLDGKLATEIQMPAGWVSAQSTGGSSFGFGGTDMGEFANRLKNQYVNTSNIQTAVGRINSRLARDFAFVLPGGGNFLMKNPVFNDNLDLLVDLTYNGAQ